MEVMEFFENGSSDDIVTSCGNGLEHLRSSVGESENIGDDLLEDLDSYLNDINDRLTISRMVSDSVIKGMVSAIEQDADLSIRKKELEVVKLKEILQFYDAGSDGVESPKSPLRLMDLESRSQKINSFVPHNLTEHSKMLESLKDLRTLAEEQFKKLKKEINSTKVYNCIAKISSGSELVGLGGILQENVAERGMNDSRMIDALRSTLNNIYQQVDEIANFSDSLVEKWPQDQEFQEKIEAMVIKNAIQDLQEQVEGRMSHQNDHFLGDTSIKYLEHIKDISKLCHELDSISKSLSVPENDLDSHGSGEMFDEWNNARRADVFHRKTSLKEGNGTHDIDKRNPENMDGAQLKHMTKDELISYFKSEMTRMKRNHESEVQEMTEAYFSLRREYLKEREFLSAPRKPKSKEFNMMKKRVPEIILEVDRIMHENEKLTEITKKIEGVENMKKRLDTLISENCHLRGLISEKRNEIMIHTSEVSDAVERLSKYSVSEANLLHSTGNLKAGTVDAHIETSIQEEVSNCVLKDLILQIRNDNEESNIIHTMSACTSELRDSFVQSILTQEVLVLFFAEAIKDADTKFRTLQDRYISDDTIRFALERKVLEARDTLSLQFEENGRLTQDLRSLKSEIETKERVILEVSAALAKVNEGLEISDRDCNRLRENAMQQQSLISEITKEADSMKCQISLYEEELIKLNQKLNASEEELRKTDDERRMLVAISQQRQTALSVVIEKEKQHRKQMESVVGIVHGLLESIADFESKVAEDIKTTNSRLENLSSLLSFILTKACKMQETAMFYKQKLEMKSSDLQKAEAEVDLLGDEVDVLMGLLEKIYIALDHYSPVLRHYPGVVEILKLVQRELTGESTKSVRYSQGFV